MIKYLAIFSQSRSIQAFAKAKKRFHMETEKVITIFMVTFPFILHNNKGKRKRFWVGFQNIIIIIWKSFITQHNSLHICGHSVTNSFAVQYIHIYIYIFPIFSNTLTWSSFSRISNANNKNSIWSLILQMYIIFNFYIYSSPLSTQKENNDIHFLFPFFSFSFSFFPLPIFLPSLPFFVLIVTKEE